MYILKLDGNTEHVFYSLNAAVTETKQKFLYFSTTKLKKEVFWILVESKISVMLCTLLDFSWCCFLEEIFSLEADTLMSYN